MTDTETDAGRHSRLAEELRALLDVLLDRGEPWLDRIAGNPGSSTGTPASCDWCPLCAAVALLRGDRSELAVRAGEQAAGLLAALRLMLADEYPAHQHDHRGERSTPGTRHGGRVQRIAISRADDTAAGGADPVPAEESERPSVTVGAEPAAESPVESGGRVQRIAISRRRRASR